MSDAAATLPDTLSRLHLISYLNWQREGEFSFEVQRAHVLDTLARLTAHMQQSQSGVPVLRHFLAGSQTILLEDVAAVRPDLIALLAIYNAGGRLSLGPWYVQTDMMLVSGEALIRSLLLGKADIARHGMTWPRSVCMPDIGHYNAQLPQILRGFGIDALIVYGGRPLMPLPFRWQSLDGSDVLVAPYRASRDAAQTILLQRDTQPDGPFLWLNECHESGVLLPDVSHELDVPVVQSTPAEYVAALRREFPDVLRPRAVGELQLPEAAPGAGRYSGRMPLKQLNERLQTRLLYLIEPLLALTLTQAHLPHPDNARAMLHYVWRLLLQNQAKPLIGGTCADAVYAESHIRNQRIEAVTNALAQTTQTALFGPVGSAAHAEKTILVVWNPHSRPVTQIVEAHAQLPDGKYPDRLLNATGQEVAYSLEGTTLIFRASAPPLGYSTYTLRLSDRMLYRQQRQTGQATISAQGDRLAIANGQIAWIHDGRRLDDVLNFYSGGDAGDLWQYRAPDPDMLVRAGMTDAIQTETTSFYERLTFQHRMRIAPGLENGGRGRGIRPLGFITTATAYDGIPAVYFRTRFTNTANDHRIRAHLRTGSVATQFLVGSGFALVKRPSSGIQPMQTVCAVEDAEGQALALFTRGLPEIEPVAEDGQTTLALTLLRAVGRLNSTTPTPGAQHQQDMVAEYMLYRLPKGDDPSGLLHLAAAYQAPLQAIQVAVMPKISEQSFLTIEDERVLLTAFKPPQTGSGWLIRLLNPTSKGVHTTIQVHRPLASVQQMTLAEQPMNSIDHQRQQFSLTIAPHQLLTLHLEFDVTA